MGTRLPSALDTLDYLDAIYTVRGDEAVSCWPLHKNREGRGMKRCGYRRTPAGYRIDGHLLC